MGHIPFPLVQLTAISPSLLRMEDAQPWCIQSITDWPSLVSSTSITDWWKKCGAAWTGNGSYHLDPPTSVHLMLLFESCQCYLNFQRRFYVALSPKKCTKTFISPSECCNQFYSHFLCWEAVEDAPPHFCRSECKSLQSWFGQLPNLGQQSPHPSEESDSLEAII